MSANSLKVQPADRPCVPAGARRANSMLPLLDMMLRVSDFSGSMRVSIASELDRNERGSDTSPPAGDRIGRCADLTLWFAQ
jgi:hypothetical protein